MEAWNVELPETLWSIRGLRHVRKKDYAYVPYWQNSVPADRQKVLHADSYQLDNMHTLSCLELCCGKHTEMTLKRLPKIRKLKCICPYSSRFRPVCDGVPHFELLTNLESLNVNHLSSDKIPCMFEFPSNLKKLNLSKRYLSRSTISKIGVRPNLEVLKLLDTAFEGEAWIIREGEFLKLKYLKLDASDITRWEVEDNSLCCLEQLVLRRCKELEKVPSCFGDIPCLQSIDVHWCSRSAAESANEVFLEQRDMGNEDFKVHIHPYAMIRHYYFFWVDLTYSLSAHVLE